MLPWVVTVVQCQRLLKGGGGGDRSFVSEPPTTAINIAIRKMKPKSLKLKSNTQRISAPSTTSENGAITFSPTIFLSTFAFFGPQLNAENISIAEPPWMTRKI